MAWSAFRRGNGGEHLRGYAGDVPSWPEQQEPSSTPTVGMPYACPLMAKEEDAVCFADGVLIAHWLFWQMSTQGTRHTPAKFIAA